MSAPNGNTTPPDDQPWTAGEIAAAKLANAIEDAATGLRSMVAAWEEGLRKQADAAAGRKARAEWRMGLLRAALRRGEVPDAD